MIQINVFKKCKSVQEVKEITISLSKLEGDVNISFQAEITE